MPDETIEWLECKCNSPEHSVRVSLKKWGDREEDVELWIEPQLRAVHLSLYQRIKMAVKILFGYKVSCFAECLISDESMNELSRLIVSYRLLKKLRKARDKKL